jgi:hypothetical protein
MLVYDNGRVCVLANTRCGHTSMYSYFGLEPHSLSNSIHDWYNTSSLRVLVLRNPLDRWLSAATALDRIGSPVMGSEEWMTRHSAPFLKDLPWRYYSWHYIDFYRLREYLPNVHGQIITNSVCSDVSRFKHNTELMRELAVYRLYRRYCPELCVDQWQLLTG